MSSVREELDKGLADLPLPRISYAKYLMPNDRNVIINFFLSHPRIGVIAEDQTWPEEPNKEYHSPDYSRGYERGQLESESANFRRIEK